MFRNNQTVDGKKFCDDLEAALIPLTYDLVQTTTTLLLQLQQTTTTI